MSRMAFNTPAALRRMNRIDELLSEKNRTLHELAELLHLDVRWTREYMNHLVAQGTAHITRWTRNAEGARNYPRPVYRLGPGYSVPKPKALTPDEVQRRRRVRRRTDPEAGIRQAKASRARRMPIRPDIAAAWFMGTAA